jgi:hypothetical protein
MAHFAELNSDNIVQRVVLVSNDVINNVSTTENEQIGIDFCKSLFGENTIWVQTSYSGKFRGRYGVQGMRYDKDRDVFLEQQPFPSWVLNTTTWYWEAPVPRPDDGKQYVWDEPTGSFIPVVNPFDEPFDKTKVPSKDSLPLPPE